MPEFNVDAALMGNVWPPPYPTCSTCGGGRFRFESGAAREDWTGGFSIWVVCLDCEASVDGEPEVVEKSYRRCDRIILNGVHQEVPGYADAPTCPACGYGDLIGGDSVEAGLDWDNTPDGCLPDTAWVGVACRNCDAIWTEFYA